MHCLQFTYVLHKFVAMQGIHMKVVSGEDYMLIFYVNDLFFMLMFLIFYVTDLFCSDFRCWVTLNLMEPILCVISLSLTLNFWSISPTYLMCFVFTYSMWIQCKCYHWFHSNFRSHVLIWKCLSSVLFLGTLLKGCSFLFKIILIKIMNAYIIIRGPLPH